MTFINVPGLAGKLYVPDGRSHGSKKHPCRDCFGCQQCSDDRCSLCRSETMAAAGRGYDRGKPMHDGKRDVDFASTVTVSEILPAVPQAISSKSGSRVRIPLPAARSIVADDHGLSDSFPHIARA
jgi:hypothetical protein